MSLALAVSLVLTPAASCSTSGGAVDSAGTTPSIARPESPLDTSTTESATTESATTESATTEQPDATPDTTATPIVSPPPPANPARVTAPDSTVWDVAVQGYVVGEWPGSRTPRPCVVAFMTVHLAQGPSEGAALFDSFAGGSITGRSGERNAMQPFCDLDGPASYRTPRGISAIFLPGSTIGVAVGFEPFEKGDAVGEGDETMLVRLGSGDAAVTFPVARLAGPPPAVPLVAGPLTVPLRPADTSTLFRSRTGGVFEVSVEGIQVVPADDMWCVVVYAKARVIDIGDPYVLWHVGQFSDGFRFPLAEGPVGACGPDGIDAFWSTPPDIHPQDVVPGAVISMAMGAQYPASGTPPTPQAVLLPSGTEDVDFSWVWVEPVVLDSPPPPPGG